MTMWRTVASRVVAATLVVVAVSVAFGSAEGGVPAAAYVVTLGALGVIEVVRWLAGRGSVDLSPVPSLVSPTTRPDTHHDPGGVVELEGLLAEASHSPRAAARRLEPRLQTLTRDRLADRAALRVDNRPDAARRLLGDEAWAVAGFDADGPATRSPDDVDHLVTRLEEL